MKLEKAPTRVPKTEEPPKEKETSNETLDQEYKELISVLEIFKPKDADSEEYINESLDDLFEAVKMKQVRDGRLIESDESVLTEAKELLNSRIKALMEDSRDHEKNREITRETKKKAKLALISLGDLSDVKRYFFGADDYEQYHVNSFANIDFGRIASYMDVDGDIKFSEADLEVLMESELKDGLFNSKAYDYFGGHTGKVEKIPESMLLGFINLHDSGDNYYLIKDSLELAEDGKYSKKVFDKLCEKNHAKIAVKFLDKFQDVELEDLLKSESLITNNLDYTIEELRKNSSIEETQKTEFIIEATKRYLLKGSFNDFPDVSENFMFAEGVDDSEEVLSIAEQGLRNFLSEGCTNNFDRAVGIIDYFSISKERLMTKEMQDSAEAYLQSVFTFGYVPSVHLIEKVRKTFGIQQEKIKRMIEEVLPKLVSKMRTNEFLYLTALYDIPENILETEEVREKVTRGFNELIEKANFYNLNLESIQNMLNNAPYLKEGYPEGSSTRDIVFEKLKEKEKISGHEGAPERYQRLKNIQESFWVNTKERLPDEIKEILGRFTSQYGRKGKDLIALAISAYGIDSPDRFVREIKRIESVLNKYINENIPEDMAVSMGIEYEVTSSIVNAYAHGSALGYKDDIRLVSESANIGAGTGALYEIAPRPNYNPYILMAEVNLLKEAGFLDFNFEKYPNAPRGYHLSLVGDSGLQVDRKMHFLHNVMTMTQLTGVTSGKDIHRTLGLTNKYSEFENIVGDKRQKGERCEIKGMATDSVEQFERSIITAHHAGIAIQLVNKYLVPDFDLLENVSTPEDFEKHANASGNLLIPFETKRQRDMVFEWVKLVRETKNAIKQHNESFIDSEFKGFFINPKGEYVDTGEHIDITRNKKLVDESVLNSEEFKWRTSFKEQEGEEESLFSYQHESFVNTLARINNIFLKSQQKNESATINAAAVLSTMKQAGYGGVLEGSAKESIFDNGGEWRDGYYYVQGASEEMITHKTQILLNEFNKNMDRLLQTKENTVADTAHSIAA